MIDFVNVSKKYDLNITALQNINISIDKGEFVFITGPSGSGKSTLLKLLVREEVPTTGIVKVTNDVVNKLKNKKIPYFRRKIGFVFQDFRLLYDRTVEENIIFALRAVNTPDKEIFKMVKDSLKQVGLEGKEKFFPNQLSGGEQQRVALARALSTKPSIIIADEPTGNLDSETADNIFKTLLEINSRGTTILVVTHDNNMVQKLNKRVISLNKGKIIKDVKGGF